MMDKLIKNMDYAQVSQFIEQVNYQPGQIVSKTLAQNKAVSLTLFAFDKDEEISTHESNGDALVVILDGVGKITIGENEFLLSSGDTIVMPSNIPHAVYAIEKFKMFLVVVFP